MFTLNTSKGDFKVGFKFDRDSKGVRTTDCNIYDQEEKIVGRGWAECSPKDNFSKMKGRKVSFGRALEDAGDLLFETEDKSWRTEMWNAYFALDMKTR